jgi:hypothetical protein
MEQIGGGEWRLIDRPWRLPHTYTLQAVKRARRGRTRRSRRRTISSCVRAAARGRDSCGVHIGHSVVAPPLLPAGGASRKWSPASRAGPGGATASRPAATSMMRSTSPGRAMTYCGSASSALISMKARNRSGSYIMATGKRPGRVPPGLPDRGQPALDGRTDLCHARPVQFDRVPVPEVTLVCVIWSCPRARASGSSRCSRTTSTAPAACMSPIVIPRASVGLLQHNESPTLAIPVATGFRWSTPGRLTLVRSRTRAITRPLQSPAGPLAGSQPGDARRRRPRRGGSCRSGHGRWRVAPAGR